MNNRLVIVGAGPFGRELMCWALEAVNAEWTSMAWVDDSADALDGHDYDLLWLGTLESFHPAPTDRCVIAAGEPETKKKRVEALRARGASFATLIHPSAVIARTARIGEGSIFCPLSFLSADARVGRFVTVNALSSVGHDVQLGDYSTLSAHVDLTGLVQVGESVFFGTGAKVVPKVRIGEKARIGAGVTVMRTVAAGTTLFAAPPRKF